MQAGLAAGEAQREEEARKAAEAKATEKKRKRDERATTRALSPRTLEKKRRKDERDAIRKEKLDLKKKEEERKKLPLITLAEEGIPTELAYTGAKSTIRSREHFEVEESLIHSGLQTRSPIQCLKQDTMTG